MNFQRMPEKVAQPPDDRKPHSEAATAVSFRVINLVELFENEPELFGGNADPGVPDLQCDAGSVAPGRYQDAAPPRVTQGVLHQIAKHALEQLWVAEHEAAGRAKSK